ncbi:MAG: site-2 protease family protein [Haloarculaceae archaeon]
MFKSYRVGQVFGIPIRIDVTFFLVVPVFAWLIAGQLEAVILVLNEGLGLDISVTALTVGVLPLAAGLLAVFGLFVGVALHELGHSLVAMRYGYEIDSITLWLLGGIAQPAEQPREWVHEFWIAITGPVVSVAIGVACYLAVLVVPSGLDLVIFLLAYLAVLNVALAVFNMLPAFPLDGGRVLRALLARSQSYVRATRQAAAVGKGFAVLLGLAGLLVFNLFWILIAFFVYMAASAESKQMLLDAAFEGVTIDELMTPVEDIETVPPDLPLSTLLDRMLADRHTGYPVFESGAFVGLVTLEDVQNAEADASVVREVMTPVEDLETVAPSSAVVDAFRELGFNEVGRLPVVEDGRLVGMVTRSDLMTAVTITMQRRRIDEPTLSGRPQ